MKGRNVMRNGQKYYQIDDVNPKLTVGNFHVDFKFRSILPFEEQIINQMVNSFWRQYQKNLEPDIEKYATLIIRQFLVALMGRLPISEFFERPCRCQ